MRMNKKGQVFGKLMGLATGVAVVAITLVVGFLIVAEGKAQASEVEGITYNASDCRQSVTCNATEELQGALSEIPGWLPLIIIASVGAILLSLVAMFKTRS